MFSGKNSFLIKLNLLPKVAVALPLVVQIQQHLHQFGFQKCSSRVHNDSTDAEQALNFGAVGRNGQHLTGQQL